MQTGMYAFRQLAIDAGNPGQVIYACPFNTPAAHQNALTVPDAFYHQYRVWIAEVDVTLALARCRRWAVIANR